MRKVLGVTAAVAACLVLLACNRTPPRQEVTYAPETTPSYGGEGNGYGEDGAQAPLPQTNGSAPYGRADVPPQYLQPRSYGGGYGRENLPPIQPPQAYATAPYGRADVPPQYPSSRSYGGGSYGRPNVPPQYPQPRSYSDSYERAAPSPQQPQPRSYGGTSYGRAAAPSDEQLVWKSSPRWSTVKSNAKKEGATPVVKRKAPDKFKLAQAKAEKVGVENLTAEDIEGLTPEQITELRGY